MFYLYNCLQCGNGVKEEGESCDLEDFGRETCQSSQGTMCVVALVAVVRSVCTALQMTVCQTEREGDYIVCVFSRAIGRLMCTEDCEIDTSSCQPLSVRNTSFL